MYTLPDDVLLNIMEFNGNDDYMRVKNKCPPKIKRKSRAIYPI